jgi:hypothetical protein
VEGFRVSLTPYTANFFEDDYAQDISNLLTTYEPLIHNHGVGRDVFALELRFPPFIQTGDVESGLFEGRFYIKS